MVITELGALNFRNYRELHLHFGEHLNVVVGANGQGKSNLVEGVYFLSHLHSFRTHQLTQLLTFGEAAGYLQGRLRRGSSADDETVSRVEISRRGRRVWLDEEPVQKLSAYAALFLALVFNPDSLYLYRHFPAERRGFFNRFLSFLDPTYMVGVREFRAAQTQKNSLLKSGREDTLVDWNQLFMERARAIITGRAATVAQLNALLPDLFATLTGRDETLQVHYQPSMTGDAERGLALLHQVREQELRAGHALYGPHRDDFQLALGEKKEAYLSQGEYRVGFLALKLAMNRLVGEQKHFRPIIILDDLFSELDEGVRQRLMTHLEALPNQTFITATEAEPLRLPPDARIMEIQAGRVQQT